MRSAGSLLAFVAVLVTVSAAQDTLITDNDFRAHAAAARDAAIASLQSLPLLRIDDRTGEKGVLLETFREVVSRLTTRLADDLERPELAGLRAYVLTALQSVPAPEVLKSPKWGECVREQSARRIIGSIRLLGDKLTKLDRLRLDLVVSTNPSDAAFRILPVGGGILFDRTTDTVVTNLYRGYYAYEISKVGHKKVSGRVNLVDERGTKLICRLVPATSEEAATPCRLLE